jgi:phosphate/sulfate permease
VVGPVVGAVALVVRAVVVVLAMVMMLAVMVTGRVVGAVLGEGGSGTPYGEGQCDGERRGYARHELHSCLLMDEFRS